MSLQNFLIRALLKRSQRALMRLSAEHRFKRGRKWMATDRSRVAKSIEVRSEVMDGVDVEWVVPKRLANHDEAVICVYFHGGAFVMGGLHSHRDMAAALAESAGIRMLMVDYRLAPEHPFPAALDDAGTVYRALLARGVSAQRLVLGGDSAGGNIALASAQFLRDAGAPLPQALFLFSPWLDLQNKCPSHHANATTDSLLNTQLLDEAAARYAPHIARNDTRLSPLLGSVLGLPPCLIIASATEILLDDALSLRDKLQKSGIKVEYLEWANTPHAFPVFARWLPEAREALKRTARFIRQNVAP